MRKVIVYIAVSIDGFIAGKDDNLDFLQIVEKPGEDYGYQHIIETIDTVIMGRKTYDKVLSFGIPFPHAQRKTYVITHTKRPLIGNIEFYNGQLDLLVHQLKQQPGKNIFVDGGAEVINQLLKYNLVDEYYISLIPVILGVGIRLFHDQSTEIKLKMIDVKNYDSGLIQIHYQK